MNMSEAMIAAASLYNDQRYFSRSEVRIRNNRIRRQRIVRRQIITLALLVAILIFAIMFFKSSFMAGATSDAYIPEFKYYKTVNVSAGDSVWSIAQDYYSADHYKSFNSYIVEICNLNSLTDANDLNAGETIIVPYYSTEFR